MANGLQVVSIRIPAVESSSVGGFINYFDQQKPEAIAKAIKDVDFGKNTEPRELINQLNKQFICNIMNLL
jgi:hypothetical protein